MTIVRICAFALVLGVLFSCDNQSSPKNDPNIQGHEFYIRLNDNNFDQQIDFVRSALPAKVVIRDSGSFAVVFWDNWDAPDSLMRAVSDHLRSDVFWLLFQSTVDAFEYKHWSNGKLIRQLTYGCRKEERTWESIEGTPEIWEAEILFPKGQSDQKLILGETDPTISAVSTAIKIAERLSFPFWH